jgi:hypothetical protein
MTPDEFSEALAFASHTHGEVEDEGRTIRLSTSAGHNITIKGQDGLELLITEEHDGSP